MTVQTHRSVSIAVFFVSMLLSVVFYIVLLRNFGALPEVRENEKRIERLTAKVDSLRAEIHRMDRR